MICRKFETEYKDLIPDMLLDRERVPAAARAHMEQCEDCSRELKALESTMLALDAWEEVEPSPFFDARLAARLREAEPAGFLERLRLRLMVGSSSHLKPLAAGALAVLLLIGGGTYAGMAGFHNGQTAPVATSATVKDLQSLEDNSQMFQELNSLDQSDSGSASGQGSN